MIRVILLGISVAFALAQPGRAAELVMVEQPGCIWCARWHAEIGPAYPNTAEGAFAPLRQISLRGPHPEDLTFEGPLRITPTFVLMVDGQEKARLEGYPGEDFFWGVIARMFQDNSDFTGGS